MKKNLGKKNWMFPMPVLMIGTYNEDGTPNAMNAAWGGITLEDEITICIDTSHKTWGNIAERKAFTVAFGTADTVKACDYLGIASGNKTPGKVAKSGFTISASRAATRRQARWRRAASRSRRARLSMRPSSTSCRSSLNANSFR